MQIRSSTKISFMMIAFVLIGLLNVALACNRKPYVTNLCAFENCVDDSDCASGSCMFGGNGKKGGCALAGGTFGTIFIIFILPCIVCCGGILGVKYYKKKKRERMQYQLL